MIEVLSWMTPDRIHSELLRSKEPAKHSAGIRPCALLTHRPSSPSIMWQEVGGADEDACRHGFVPGAALTNAFAQPKMGSFPAEASEPEARRRACPRASQPDVRLTRWRAGTAPCRRHPRARRRGADAGEERTAAAP